MPWLKGKRILVVEDEALIAVMVEDMLSDMGCSVVGPAATIEQALALARAEEVDRVRGLETGADDYVIKPYSMVELMARARAQVRLG